jgi:hypothetical protein
MRSENSSLINQLAAEFCSQYLPQMVERIIANTIPSPETVRASPQSFAPIASRDMLMLSTIAKSPYFGKYLRSNKPSASEGKKLPRVIAVYICSMGMQIEGDWKYPSKRRSGRLTMLCLTSILPTLIIPFITHDDSDDFDGGLFEDVRAQLLKTLRRWKELLSEEDTRPIGLSISLLAGIGPRENLSDWRNLGRGRKGCGLRDCQVTDADLKVCARCVSICLVIMRFLIEDIHTQVPHHQICESDKSL